MSLFTSNTAKLKYAGTELWIELRSVDDDSFLISRALKQALYLWSAVEKFRGWRRMIKLGFNSGITDSQRLFLAAFLKDATDTRKVTIEGVEYDVRFKDPRFGLGPWNGYIDALVIDEWILVEKALNRTMVRTYALGTTTSATAAILGYNLTLSYDYGDGAVSRRFHCDLCNSFDLELQRKEWEYADDEPGEASLGLKVLTEVLLGSNPLGTSAQQQDDRDWTREFLLAPSKTITPVDGIASSVVNDFDEVDYELEDGFIGAKNIKLQFKSVATSTSVPTL